MSSYPSVIDEAMTLVQIGTRECSVARFGDGELRLISGKSISCQQWDQQLAFELQAILQEEGPELACIPHPASPNPTWERYKEDQYVKYYKRAEYGSAFITRPDSAPWIDTPGYWTAVRKLWYRKNVILVAGSNRSLRIGDLTGARDVTRISAPPINAYFDIDRIEAAIKQHPKNALVVLCLGPTATVLARRLAHSGRQALDLGHIGMFLRYAGQMPLENKRAVYDRVLAENGE